MQINQNNKLEASTQNILTFNQLWLRYVSYWPLYVILMLVGFGIAKFYLKYTMPVYESTAKVLIKDEKKGADDSKGMEALNLINTKKIIDNELEVIQSRTLLLNVVKQLKLYAPVFEKGEIVDPLGYITSPITISYINPDSLNTVIDSSNKKAKKIKFSYNNSQKTVSIGSNIYGLNTWVNTQYGTLMFTENVNYVKPEKEKSYYFQLIDPKQIVIEIQDNLKAVTASKPATIMNITLKDHIPQRGNDILNALIKNYNIATIEDKNTLAKNTLTFFEARLKVVAQDLDSVGGNIQNYKYNNSAVDLTDQMGFYIKDVSDNDKQITDYNMKLAALEQIESHVSQNSSNSQILAPSMVGITDPGLERLLSRLYESEMQYDKVKRSYAENNPIVLAAKEQVEKTRPSILENISSIKKNLQASLEKLKLANNAINAKISTLPKKERDIISLKREETSRNDIYMYLLKKREDVALSYASTVSDSRIIDPADSTGIPISPLRGLILVGSIIGGLLLGLGIITLYETFNKTVFYKNEIESETLIPVIGEISKSKDKIGLVVEDNKSIITEQFRKLRVTLGYIGINNTHNKLMVTSSIPNEGKSFIAANLALSIAKTGKKVVVLSLDLHNPSIDDYFQTNVIKKGISEYLNGKTEIEEIIQVTKNNSNLFFIGSGNLVDNPSELILNGKLIKLFQYVSDAFDYVIVDTPPTGTLTDAYNIGEFCDSTLYVIRQKLTPKSVVANIDQNNRISMLNNMGIVFNGIKPLGFFSNNNANTYQYPLQAPTKKWYQWKKTV